jgi:hypothetical protein
MADLSRSRRDRPPPGVFQGELNVNGTTMEKPPKSKPIAVDDRVIVSLEGLEVPVRILALKNSYGYQLMQVEPYANPGTTKWMRAERIIKNLGALGVDPSTFLDALRDGLT